MELSTISMIGQQWHDADDLRRLGHLGPTKLSRFQFVDRYDLQHGSDFIFVSTQGAIKQERTSRNDRVLLSCDWLARWQRRNDPKPAAKRARSGDTADDDTQRAEEAFMQDSDVESAHSTCSPPAELLRGVNMPQRVELSMLPKIELHEEDWFHGYDMEFRGERHCKYLYVRAMDVANYLGVRAALADRKSLDVEDYITVYENNKGINYLRYLGLLRLLFTVRKSKLADEFQVWASSALFLMQFPGNEPASMSNSVPHSVCRPFLRTTVGALSGIFACWLNTVGELKTVLNIPNNHFLDEDGVYYIGFTKNLALELTSLRNLYELQTQFRVRELQVTMFSPIDAKLDGLAQRRMEHEIRELLPCRFVPHLGANALYALRESSVRLVRAAAHKLYLELGTGLVEHAVAQKGTEMTMIHQREMKEQQFTHQQEMLEMRQQMIEVRRWAQRQQLQPQPQTQPSSPTRAEQS